MNNDFMAFIRFLDNREEYDARLKELATAEEKSKIAEERAINEQSEAAKRVDLLNAEIENFEPYRKELRDLQGQLNDREMKLEARDNKLKEDRKEVNAVKKEAETLMETHERFEKNMSQREDRVNEIKADNDSRIALIKDKEEKLKDYFNG